MLSPRRNHYETATDSMPMHSSPIRHIWNNLAEGFSSQKDLIIDFKDGYNEFDDIQTLTNRISSFDEHLLDDIGGSTLFPRKLCCQRKNTNSDLSHYLRAREDILREIDAKSRSGSKCIGEERSHKSGSLPCLGFYNCMMIQDE